MLQKFIFLVHNIILFSQLFL